MNCSNAGSETIASDVDSSRRNSNVRSKSLRNDEKYVANIIDLLIQTSTLEKEKSKDHSWKEVAVKLMRRLWNDSEGKNNKNQNAFIAKNVQKLKTFVQLLNKQLQTSDSMQTQDSMRFSSRITSWTNVTREEVTTRKQRLRDELSSLRKKREVMMKIAERKKIEKIQKKSIEQILQEITNVLTAQRNLIMSLRKLESEDITLHAVSSEVRANLKRSQTWAKEIANSTRIVRRIFTVLAHEVRITIDTSNQKVIIKRLVKDNARLHENLEILRIVWFKKVVESEKTHSSLIVEIAIEAMTNQLMNENMLDSYQECSCKLFEKNCHITQFYRCFEFDHMIRFCKKKQRCAKCADKHHIEECVMSSNKRCCVNCNEDHELWRRICFKWRQQMKQTSEIYRNRSIRYSKASKYNRAFLSLFLNSLSSINSLNSTDFADSTNSSSSAIIMLKTCNRDIRLTWQAIEVKKRRVDLFSCATSDSDEMTSEQTQKHSIRKRERLSVIKSIQRVFSAQSQQQLQITLWQNNSFYEFYSTTSESHWRFKNHSWSTEKFANST